MNSSQIMNVVDADKRNNVLTFNIVLSYQIMFHITRNYLYAMGVDTGQYVIWYRFIVFGK